MLASNSGHNCAGVTLASGRKCEGLMLDFGRKYAGVMLAPEPNCGETTLA